MPGSETSRIRMIAGPNGSGKSTLVKRLKPEWLGYYLNPDDILACIGTTGYFNLENFPVTISATELYRNLRESKFLRSQKIDSNIYPVEAEAGKLTLNPAFPTNKYPYVISAIADFLRYQLIADKVSFTFETVMSHPSKCDLLEEAKASGYRTYLYFVATEDPDINIARVAQRVLEKGHSVPATKIRERYYRTLQNLTRAVELSDRAYIFDNSQSEAQLIVEFSRLSNNQLTMKLVKSDLPYWIQAWLENADL